MRVIPSNSSNPQAGRILRSEAHTGFTSTYLFFERTEVSPRFMGVPTGSQ